MKSREQRLLFSDQAFVLDAATLVIISICICFFAQKLLLMSWIVPFFLVLRFVCFALLAKEKKPFSLGTELLFFSFCTVLGGFNDWNSVVHHQIYDYTVPAYFPKMSTIPIWMLLFWGMILRFLFSLFRWHRMEPPQEFEYRLFFGKQQYMNSAFLRIGFLLVLMFVTRQCIYRFSLHPFLSWFPFALGLLVFLYFCRPSRYYWKLWGIFLIGGPGVEILFIQVGGLHAYQLGWIGGVPLWIVLWWLLVIPIWNELVLFLFSVLSSHGTVQRMASKQDRMGSLVR